MHQANEKMQQICIYIHGSYEKKHPVIDLIHEANEKTRNMHIFSWIV